VVTASSSTSSGSVVVIGSPLGTHSLLNG
jgi:hypothetical protein